MKNKILLFALLFTFLTTFSYAQFDKPVFQLGVGIVNPDMQLRGNDYINYSNPNTPYYYWKYNPYPNPPTWDSIFSPTGFAMVDSNFLSKNYGAKTGFYINGTAKINVDKYETFRLVGSLSFAVFNAFQSTKSGYIPLLTYGGAYSRPIDYDYSLNNFGIGLGLEVAPLAFTKVVSPFVGANLSFNFLNAKLSRTTGPNDSTTISFADFRMGVNLNAGLEFRVNPQWGIVLGAKYDFGNLLFKNTDRSGLIEWGRTNASFNDEQGYYTSNLYGAIGDRYRDNIKSDDKTINWATFYIGVNFYPDIKKKK